MVNNDNSLEELQKLYDDGFRCIKYEDANDDEMKVYLKNFETEESREMRIKSYLNKAYVTNYVNSYGLIR